MRTASVVGNAAAVLATLTFVVTTLEGPVGRPAPTEELVVIARDPEPGPAMDRACAATEPADGEEAGPIRAAGPGGAVGPPAPPALGTLTGRGSRGEEARLFPLERTDLGIDVAGWLASTVVRQTFANPFPAPIDAVYVFPSDATSGSMQGLPLETSRRLARRAIEGLRGVDAFNLIEAAGRTRVLAREPLYVCADARREAEAFLAHLRGDGATSMLQAVHLAVEQFRAVDVPPWGFYFLEMR